MRRAILLVGAGVEQVSAIQLAQALGLSVVAVDGSPAAPGLVLANEGFCLDIRDVDALAALAKEKEVAGVFSHAVEIPHIVATVCERLGLPGLAPEVAWRATNKLLRYQCFQEYGVPCPLFRVARSVEDAMAQAPSLGYPFVMKPLDCAGARGVRLVHSLDDIKEAFHWTMQFSREQVVLLEEYLEGPEISTESVIVDGRIVTTGFADRNYQKKRIFDPYFIEDGHTIPSCIAQTDRRAVLYVIEQAIRALGINWGVAKGDVILTERGPVVFEMAARTSGGRFCADMVPLATGVQILKPLIQMAVGDPVDQGDLEPTFHRAAAQRFIFPSPGEILSIEGIARARRLPGIYDVVLRPDVRVGGVIKPFTHHGDRIGHVIASGETREEAVARAEEAVRTIQINTAHPVGVHA